MNKNEQPIPLSSIIILPRWMMIGCVTLSAACILAGIAMIVYGIAWDSRSIAGWIGSAIGCIAGGGGALFGTLCDWRRRLPANVYLRYIHNDKVLPFYRKVFRPALVTLCVGLFVGSFVWNNPAIWHGVVQTSGILTFISGSMEAMRRHTTRQARMVFALYADGVLEPGDTKAIDDARKKDQKFDKDVVAYLEISEKVCEFAAGV